MQKTTSFTIKKQLTTKEWEELVTLRKYLAHYELMQLPGMVATAKRIIAEKFPNHTTKL